MLKQLWQRLVQFVRRLLHLDAPPPPARLHPQTYQQLFERLLAGVAGGWNQAEIVQHLGERLNDKHFRAWLREYGGQLRQLPEGDHKLGWQMTKLSRAGCGQLGEMAAEIGRELLAKPAKKSQEPRLTKRQEPQGGVTSNGGGNQPELDDAEGWIELGYQRYFAGDFAGAIASLDRALAINPDYHEAWFKRGNALLYLGRYEEAIASFDRALAIKPDDHYAWGNRGAALVNLGRYEAIASYDRALAIKPDDHEAWYNRGVALRYLGKNEEAIASFDRALAIKPDNHEACYNRGIALGDLGRYEEAIASYDRALAVKPDDHEAWSNRGVALDDLGKYEEAIASYDRALAVKPDLHQAWSNRGVALHNLGKNEEVIASYDRALAIKPDLHEAWSNRGVALGRLGKNEEAIASFDRALAIKPDKHEAWLNRGIGVGNSRGYNPQAAANLQIQFPQLPPLFPNPELTKRGYQGEKLCYQTGLQHCPQATHPEGWGRLHQFMGNAHYFESKRQPNYRDYWQKAEAEYRLALTALTATAFPQRHLETVQEFLRVLLALGKEEEAKTWRRQGVEVYLQLLNSPQSSHQKKQLRAKFIVFAQMQVDELAADGAITLALQAAEANKNLYLSWILDAQNTNIFSPSYAEIQQLVKPQTALIYWHLSPLALTTFLILPATEPILIPTPQRQALAQLIDKWDREYQAYRGKEGNRNASWKENLPTFLEQLGEILQVATILPYLQSVQQLVLVPHQDLHRLPLHALFPDSYTMTYLPSAQLGINLQSVNVREGFANLLCIEPPTKDDFTGLPLAAVEAEAIIGMFSQHRQVASDKARKETVMAALAEGYQIWHFTGHASYDFQKPENSALYLQGNDNLTVGEILQLKFEGASLPGLVCLAACETAITGRESIDKEYVGLVSGFVYKGIPYTVSTLWTVPEAGSSLLMVYFYWQLKKGKSPAVGLAKASQWLKNVSYKRLGRMYQVVLARVSVRVQSFLRSEILDIGKMGAMELEQKPFASPYFWAGFTVTGRVD